MIIKDDNGGIKLDTDNNKVKTVADLSVFSFLKIIAKINKLK